MRRLALFVCLLALPRLSAGAPNDRELTRLMIGAWESPRHDYIYFSDGTWWMGNPRSELTHGRWRISNQTLVESTTYCGGQIREPKEERYPIQKLTQTEIVFGHVFHMKRIGLADVDHQ